MEEKETIEIERKKRDKIINIFSIVCTIVIVILMIAIVVGLLLNSH